MIGITGLGIFAPRPVVSEQQKKRTQVVAHRGSFEKIKQITMDHPNTISSHIRLPLSDIGKKTAEKLYRTVHQRVGTIVPWHWLSQLRTPAGKTDSIAAIVLADVVNWWTPYPVSQGSTKLRKKFHYDLPQISYSHYMDQAGWSREQVRRAFCRLEEAGFITRVFRNVKVSSPYQAGREIVLQSRMFVDLHVDALFAKLGEPKIEIEDSDAEDFDLTIDPIKEDAGRDSEPVIEAAIAQVAEAEFQEPVAGAPTATVVQFHGCNRQMDDAEMDLVAQAQDAKKSQAFDYRDRNIYPAWRTGWSRRAIRPEFLQYLKSEFAKHDWGSKTTPQRWMSAREPEKWTEILNYWDAFLESESRRAQNSALTVATAIVTAPQSISEEDALLDTAKKCLISMGVSNRSAASLERATARLTAACDAVRKAGLVDQLQGLIAQYPAALPYLA
jgi:hypothetical protein